MWRPTLRGGSFALVLGALVVFGAGRAMAEGAAVMLLLPPGATPTEDERDALSELKTLVRDAGYDLTGVGQFDPTQALPLAKLGGDTGVVTYDGEDSTEAERVVALLEKLYPEIVVHRRSSSDIPLPEGSIGVLLPGVVVVDRNAPTPPPWNLFVRNVIVEVDEGMDRTPIATMVVERSAELMGCWPDAVAKGKRMEGVVKVRVSVSGDGEPMMSSVQIPEDTLEPWIDCVSQVYLEWTYPRTADGRSTNIYITVNFEIDE